MPSIIVFLLCLFFFLYELVLDIFYVHGSGRLCGPVKFNLRW